LLAGQSWLVFDGGVRSSSGVRRVDYRRSGV
jgi:hypothetical protein